MSYYRLDVTYQSFSDSNPVNCTELTSGKSIDEARSNIYERHRHDYSISIGNITETNQ